MVAKQRTRPAPGARDQVERLGDVLGEEDLDLGGGVDELRNPAAGAFVAGRRLFGERVHAAVHVGVRALVFQLLQMFLNGGILGRITPGVVPVNIGV